ncbi:hypothetical protein VKT23_007777 [Stygiomarasmius scandens]|uniref:Uncharacterized protein n=1 Tax=Marasmiellus scandens TaxID=2682957 RepID=A0ABR1JKW7_9AGAR
MGRPNFDVKGIPRWPTNLRKAHPKTQPTLNESVQGPTPADNTQDAGGFGDGFDQSQPPSNAHPETQSTPNEPVQGTTHTDNTQDAGGSGDSGDGFDQSGSETQPVDIDESGIPTPEIRQKGSFTGNNISGSSFDFVSGDQQRIENNNNQVTHNTYNNNYNNPPKAGLGMLIATGAGGIGVGTAGSSLYYKYWEPKAPRANNVTECPNLAISVTLAAVLSKTKIRVLFDVCRNV